MKTDPKKTAKWRGKFIKNLPLAENRMGEARGDAAKDPNAQWHGRYCQDCGKKILGFNHKWCRSCHSKRISAAGNIEPEAAAVNGQNLMAL